VEFDIEKREKQVKYNKEDYDVARKFAEKLYKELGNFVQALILFGSTTTGSTNPKKDIDVLIILDDVRIKFTKELVETYRIITEKTISEVDPKRLHIQSMKLSSFWEYIRAGDPVAINILRGGVSLIDTGFFDPLQILLEQGRIRPTKEAVYTYFSMAPASITKAEQHLLTAVVDLYWACIDAAHAALMKIGEIPPTPEHVSLMLEKKLVTPKLIKGKYADIMHEMYVIFKKIVRREIKTINGKEYDRYYSITHEFVEEMKKIIIKK